MSHVLCYFSLTESLGNQATSQSRWPCTGIGSSTSVDFYFSRIRGIKIDTNNSETKQGAVVPCRLVTTKTSCGGYNHIVPLLAARIF
jgi:hypothetical protein